MIRAVRRFMSVPEATTTTVTGPNSGNYGTALHFVVTVTDTDGSGTTPQGNVDWYDTGGTYITTTALDGAGQASIDYAPLIGTRNIDCNYVSSDANQWTNSSGSKSGVVIKYQTTAVVSEAPDPIGQPPQDLTMTATVTKTFGGGPVDAGATVQFYINGVLQGSNTTDGGGVATLVVTNPGTWHLSNPNTTDINYLANGDFLASSGSGSFTGA